MQFADHFSRQAEIYAARRPRYPAAVFAWMAAQAARQECAWDAGCGNGQAALGLAGHFQRVVASEPSAAQLAAATAHPRVEYRQEPAESPSLDDASVDLVCVAQALHWFEPAAFHAAVRRVMRPDGVLVAISYGLCSVSPDIDRIFMQLYEDMLGPWWPPERRHVENGYRDLPFPWVEAQAPPTFAMQPRWSLDAYLGYLRSWSATQRYQQERGEDPVAEVETRLAAAWGDPTTERVVDFPLRLRVGRAAQPG